MIDGVVALRKLTMAAARYSGAAALARPFFGGIGVILMLHRVTAALPKPLGLNSHLAVRPDFLDAVLTDMKRQGYRFVSMDEAIRLLLEPDGGAPFAAITLDDGYRDNLHEALPVFEKHRAPFTLYIAPGLIDRSVDLWWEVLEDVVTARDRVEVETGSGSLALATRTPAEKINAYRRLAALLTREVKENDQQSVIERLGRGEGFDAVKPSQALLMDWSEIRHIANHPLCTIGAHTIHHYALRRLREYVALDEIIGAADRLEREIGIRPRHMAYPYGFAEAVGRREARLARQAGFASAVTTRHGMLQPEHAAHLHELPRLSLNGRYQTLGFVRTMLSGLTAALVHRSRVVTM